MTITDFIAARAKETYPEPPMPIHTELTDRAVELIAERLPEGASVLDVGCGQGTALRLFEARGFNAIGTGINSTDVNACRDAGLGVIHRDMHDMGYFSESVFDLVFARHVLEHSVAPFYVLNEFARVVRHGGWLYVEVPAHGTSAKHESNANHYSVMPLDMWRSLIERAGFVITDTMEWSLTFDCGPDSYWIIIAQRK